jgi:hypothetical protein
MIAPAWVSRDDLGVNFVQAGGVIGGDVPYDPADAATTLAIIHSREEELRHQGGV